MLGEAVLQDFDSTYLRLDASNDPLTGELDIQSNDMLRLRNGAGSLVHLVNSSSFQFGTNAYPTTNQLTDLGLRASSGLWRNIRGRLINGFGASNSAGAIATPSAIGYGSNPTGIIGGNIVEYGGTATVYHGGGSFKPVASIGNVFAGAGSTFFQNQGGGSFLGGSAYNYAGGTCTLRSAGYGNFTWAYSYVGGSNPHNFINQGPGAFLSGYSQGAGTVNLQCTGQAQGAFCQGRPAAPGPATTAQILARGPGQFVQGRVNTAGGTGISEISGAVNSQGSFAQGVASADGRIQSNSFGTFAQGEATSGSDLIASARGAFAHGSARGGNNITASGAGSFAVGDSNTGAIGATAANASQFGVGTNAQADSLQVGAAGLRFKGTTGAPAAPQNGDFWVNAGYVYVRSNNTNIQIAGPGPLTN